MARKKTEIMGNLTLSEEPQETIIANAPKAAPPQPETPSVGLLAEDKQDAEASKRTDPPVDLDTTEQEAYLTTYGLSDFYEKRNGTIVCRLLNNKGQDVIGYDLKTRQPMAFGLTEQRALCNAVERHKQLAPIPQKSTLMNPIDLCPPISFKPGSDNTFYINKDAPLAAHEKKLLAALKEFIAAEIHESEGGLRDKLRKLL
jgi:hypothetical protein